MFSEVSASPAKNIADFSEISLVFNMHKDAKNAAESLAEVADNSLVFTEGHMLDPAYARDRSAALKDVAEKRLLTGGYDEAATRKFHKLAEVFLNREVTAANLSDEHSYWLFIGLLAKNCVVLPADYINTAGDDLSQFNLYVERATAPAIDENADFLKQAIRFAYAMHAIFEQYLEYQEFREAHARARVAEALVYYQERGLLETIAKNQAGKAQVFVLFGSGHRSSLTEKFLSEGLPVTSTVIDESERCVEDDLKYQRQMPRTDYLKPKVIEWLRYLQDRAEYHSDHQTMAELSDLIEQIKAKQ